LAGSDFLNQWGGRTASDLISFMRLTMPPGTQGSLGEQAYVNLAAFLLQSNGAPAGSQTLDANANFAIGSAATGRPAGAQKGKQQGKQAPPPARGITVAGDVKNYTPVTDAMLRNPDPGDWLMIRRDYRASNYSPLNQINRENVQDLRLAWVWAMNEGGTNQPAPIVHNGILYLNNTGNLMQALDARTGELIWEKHYGGAAAAQAVRGIAI
jgi:alcohol dehydrogenase (cytochrome c)